MVMLTLFITLSTQTNCISMPQNYNFPPKIVSPLLVNTSTKGAFFAVLFLLITAMSGNAKTQQVKIETDTSINFIVGKTAAISLLFPATDNNKTSSIYTYIYNPLFYPQNKGDCLAGILCVLPPLWSPWTRVPIIQNKKTAYPLTNIIHLILNT
jgi:hypothetical protein